MKGQLCQPGEHLRAGRTAAAFTAAAAHHVRRLLVSRSTYIQMAANAMRRPRQNPADLFLSEHFAH